MAERKDEARRSQDKVALRVNKVQKQYRNGRHLWAIDELKKMDVDFKVSPQVKDLDSKRAVIEERERKRAQLKRMGYDDADVDDMDIREIQNKYKFRSRIGLFGLFCIVSVAFIIVYTAGIKLADILINEFDTYGLIYYLILLIIGIGAFVGGIRMARNIILVDHIFDDTFENAIYPRLEPALKEVAKVQVEIDDIKDQLERMNLNITRSRDFPAVTDNPLKLLEASIYNFLRYVFLINLSLAIVVFILLYPSSIMPYVLTLLFPIWWIGITVEYKLWKVDEVWAWVFLPILIVPTTVFLFDGIIEHGTLVGLIGAGLVGFAFAYRSWAKYYVEGSIRFTTA
jgi:hypothetical protein